MGKITFTIAGCSDSPPGGTPLLLSAVSKGSNQIILTWTGTTNPVSHYLVSYGLASGQYMYGNPNVGGQGTTSYTVGSLSPGKKYYFVVKAVNGCTPGNFSNEVSTTAGGVVVSSPTPEQTSPTIASSKTKTENSDLSTVTDTPTPLLSMQPTTVILPTQAPPSDDSKSNMLVIISAGIVIIGSIGNFLYWKHKKNAHEYTKAIGENQRL